MRWTGAYVVDWWLSGPAPAPLARSGSEAWRSISAVGGVGGEPGKPTSARTWVAGAAPDRPPPGLIGGGIGRSTSIQI